jgi:hypothetical protein
MKKTLLFLTLLVAMSGMAIAQNTIDNPFFDHVKFHGAFGTVDWTSGWANFDPQNTVYPSTTVTVEAGDISANTTWTSDKVYLLNGWVYVTSGATLTIQAGTVIRGDKANKGSLIVEPGGKLVAQGTISNPIVFTSNQAVGSRTYGDWGGVVICGNAITNKVNPQIEGGPRTHYGGTNDTESSGILKFVRIEFPGIAFQPDKEINGLTLGGVGSGTVVDYIQVSYSGDDSYEWFGGSVNAKHLIAIRGWDDDFDTDYGYHGMIQYAVSLRDPAIADAGSGSNGFESDNDATGSASEPLTSAIFSNVSMFGPLVTPETQINSNYKRGMHLRRNTALNIYNAIFAGYLTGLYIEGPSITNAKNNALRIENTILAGCKTNFGAAASDLWTVSEETDWFSNSSRNNDISPTNAALSISDPFNLIAPNFLPTLNSPVLSGSYWDYSGMPGSINNPFFEHVAFRGAFGTEDWTAGWANFDPQNTVYPATTVIVEAGDISANTTWTSDKVYLLNGWVYVTSGATLTIQAGTVIRGDKANKGSLIVEPGGKLIAQGTMAKPIVFTSNQAAGSRTYGDWGGVVVCGNAITNKVNPQIEGGPRTHYGGTNDTESSGILNFIRIEFPGIAFQPDKEINGLTLGGVGSGTTVDYIQVSYSGDDSYEWFGGSVNAKHLIAIRGWDDDFDTDYGYHGMIQYAVSLRDPAIADAGSGSNGFESDNDATGSAAEPFTSAIFSNVSMFGPLVTPETQINSNYKRGMHLRRNTALNIYNALFAGYLTGLYTEGPSITNAKDNKLKIENIVLAGCKTNFGAAANDLWNVDEETAWFNSATRHNQVLAKNGDLAITDPFNLLAPNFLPMSTSTMLGGSYWNATGINVVPVAETLVVYPNPVSSTLHFGGDIAVKSVRLINITGQVVMETRITNNQLSVGDLNPGLYIIQTILENGKIATQKVYKQ